MPRCHGRRRRCKICRQRGALISMRRCHYMTDYHRNFARASQATAGLMPAFGHKTYIRNTGAAAAASSAKSCHRRRLCLPMHAHFPADSQACATHAPPRAPGHARADVQMMSFADACHMLPRLIGYHHGAGRRAAFAEFIFPFREKEAEALWSL